MVVMMDLDQNPQQQALALLPVSMDNIMSFNIDVSVMINDLITSGEKEAEYSPQSSTIVMQVVLVMTAMAPQFAYIMNRKLQPEDTYSTRHERKPRLGRKPHLQDGTVTVDTDKYRLVGIPPSGCEPPDVGLTRIR